MSSLLPSLRWRYATKKFDPTKKLTNAQLDELLEVLRLSASSFGLQAYKFLVIENPDLRAKIREHAWNQSQITDASHLIALCSFRTLPAEHIDAFAADIAMTRGIPMEKVQPYREMMAGFAKAKTPAEVQEWLKRQTYIALGFLLTAAAEMKIDTCPIEGFDGAQVDKILNTEKDNLTVVTFCPVGFRASDDAYASLAKVRFAKEKMIESR